MNSTTTRTIQGRESTMRIRTGSDGILLFSGLLLTFEPLLRVEAQDMDVPGNLTMHDSTDPTVGNVLKEGVPFLHNYGMNNTFLGVNAGNFTMTGFGNNAAMGVGTLSSNTEGGFNTAIGNSALLNNTTGIDNTASGVGALQANTTGNFNTATGVVALGSNRTGGDNTAVGEGALYTNGTGGSNTAIGARALFSNSTGSNNTAIGTGADVFRAFAVLNNATAIGNGAVADDSNKIRLGNTDVTVIEGQVPYTYTSDRNEKENFQPVKAEEVLTKIRGLSVTSWNYKGQAAKQFRHYGPMAQDFFAAFGHDAVGTIGTPTTITSGDLDGILMIAVQALEKRTVEQEKQIAGLKAELELIKRRVGSEVAANVSAGL